MSTLRVSLPQAASSPAAARHQVASFMRYNGLCRDPTTALLIVSELVTNAVVHGIAPIEVMVSDEAGELRIEVSDGDSLEPRPTVPSAVDHIGGRGLRIVNKLARYWGVNLHDFGKTVWAEVRA